MGREWERKREYNEGLAMLWAECLHADKRKLSVSVYVSVYLYVSVSLSVNVYMYICWVSVSEKFNSLSNWLSNTF